MPSVLLIGDSIRISYSQRVKELLAGKADLSWPEDNCRYSAYTLFGIRGWLADNTFDVIQWNNGQWDTARLLDGVPHTPLDQYLANTKRIATILKPFADQLVFATTTPVHADMIEAGAANPRTNEDINAYNDAARKLLEPMGVDIVDLNTPLAGDIHKYISKDRVHLTPEGVEVCAQAVAANIAHLLER